MLDGLIRHLCGECCACHVCTWHEILYGLNRRCCRSSVSVVGGGGELGGRVIGVDEVRGNYDWVH